MVMLFVIGLGFVGLILLLYFLSQKSSDTSTAAPPPCLSDPKWGNHRFLVQEGSGLKMHYVEKGDREKPLMIFLHGFPEFWYSWRQQLLHHSSRYWCVVPDMRGYGETDKPNGIHNYAMDLLIEDVKQLVLGLGRSQCVLVGHDWGGTIGYAFAAVYPEMVQAYIGINTVHGLSIGREIKNNWKQRLMSWYVYFFQIPYLPETLLYLRGSEQMFTQVFKTGGLSDIPCAAEDIKAYSYTFREKHSWTCGLNYYRAAFKHRSVHYKKMKQIGVPVYSIFGTGDEYISVAAAQGCKDFCSDYQETLLEGVKHWSLMEKAEQVNQLMEKYLTDKGL